jgi:hypothetical protein
MSQTNLNIDIDLKTGAYKATVNDSKAKAKRAGHVSWLLSRKDGFPKKANVILQFVDKTTDPKTPIDGPFDDGKKTKGRYETKGKTLGGTISLGADGPYNYKLSYIDNGTEKELLDPELIVDGNSGPLAKFLKSVRAEFKRLQQRLKSRGGSTRKKAKKAKRAKKR